MINSVLMSKTMRADKYFVLVLQRRNGLKNMAPSKMAAFYLIKYQQIAQANLSA